MDESRKSIYCQPTVIGWRLSLFLFRSPTANAQAPQDRLNTLSNKYGPQRDNHSGRGAKKSLNYSTFTDKADILLYPKERDLSSSRHFSPTFSYLKAGVYKFLVPDFSHRDLGGCSNLHASVWSPD